MASDTVLNALSQVVVPETVMSWNATATGEAPWSRDEEQEWME